MTGYLKRQELGMLLMVF